MPWIRPSLTQIIERIVRDMESRLTGLVALLKVATLRILATIFGGAIHILYGYIKYLMDEYLPDKAKELLPRHGYIWGVSRKSPDFTTGTVIFTGVNTTSIEQSLQVQRGDGVLYITLSSGIISDNFCSLSVEAVEAGEDGNIIDGETLSLTEAITGIDDVVHTAIWNVPYTNLAGGDFDTGDTIDNTLQSGQALVIEGDPSGTLGYIRIVILDGIFEDGDSISNGVVTADISETPTNINEFSGGVDAESDEDWRSRILQRIQNPPSGGSKDDVERWAGEVLGVEKGWCFSITPSTGWVTVVIKALGSNIIPSAPLLLEVYDYIVERICVTANVVTIAIEPVTISYIIAITPNIVDFQNKITENLTQLKIVEMLSKKLVLLIS
jgi:uncharacterized phage protein gp47/JayE